MTLNDLIRKANALAMQMSSGDVKLYDVDYVEIQNVDFSLQIDNDGTPFIWMEVK